MTLLDDVLARVHALEPGAKAELARVAMAGTAHMRWVPNPGPQTDAFNCPADELFYGGQAGGGKTDLLVGLSLSAHKRSLVLRRTNVEATKLVERYVEVLGSRVGWNGQDDVWRTDDGRVIDIRGCQHEDDKQKFKGTPHDFFGFDEVSDFTESQYRFIIGWNRSTDAGQRCRVVAAGNPPTRPEGLWVIRYWAPWLDPNHPNPAQPGELRWFTTVGGEDAEVDGPGPHLLPGETVPVMARSRSFIPARLEDNPDLARTNYRSVLSALPEELRSAYLEGRFDSALKDHDKQAIPTAWIEQAQARWMLDGYKSMAMTVMAVDPAGGGADAMEICWRYGGWYAPLVTVRGPETADGSASAAQVIRYRRDGCPVVVDSGGGYGGSISLRLKDNGVGTVPFNGAMASSAITRDAARLKFANKRAEVIWRFREALDPNQEGGSAVALPPDAELKADLAAYHWDLSARGIQIESKDEIRKRLGRSPGKGDAVVMCLSEGTAAVKRAVHSGARPQVNIGHSALKQRLRGHP